MFNFRNALLFYFPPPTLQECRHIHCSALIQKEKEKRLVGLEVSIALTILNHRFNEADFLY